MQQRLSPHISAYDSTHDALTYLTSAYLSIYDKHPHVPHLFTSASIAHTPPHSLSTHQLQK